MVKGSDVCNAMIYGYNDFTLKKKILNNIKKQTGKTILNYYLKIKKSKCLTMFSKKKKVLEFLFTRNLLPRIFHSIS